MESSGITKKNQVYTALKQRIVNNEIPVEDPLTVRELCSEYNVSRTTIREVLESLIAEGLLKQMKGVGYFVNVIDYQEMVEIYELREVLEVMAIKLFIERMNQERKGQFKELVQLQEKAYWNNDHKAFMRQDMNIHELIVKGAKNKKLESALNSIYTQIRLMANVSQDDPAVREMANRSHSLLLKSVERHDAQGAQRVMQQHIAEVRNYHKSRYYLYNK